MYFDTFVAVSLCLSNHPSQKNWVIQKRLSYWVFLKVPKRFLGEDIKVKGTQRGPHIDHQKPFHFADGYKVERDSKGTFESKVPIFGRTKSFLSEGVGSRGKL